MRKCTTQEIIREVPDVQTVVLPANWFSRLVNSKPVFISLYEWMLEKGRIPLDNKNTLPSRTYVGEKTFAKLITAERDRIRKKLKLKGDDLESAVAWSDMDSGPKSEIGGCKIAGEGILVIPESSRQALGQFSIRTFKKSREAEIKKVKTNAAGSTFYLWLLSQIDRPDRVGDLARDTAVDEEFPRDKKQYEEIKSYLDSIGACSAAIESFKMGWLEYLQQYPERVESYAWCCECGKRIAVENALLSWSLEFGDVYVLDPDCLCKHKNFGQIESLPLSGVSYGSFEELIEKDEISEFEIERIAEILKLWGVLPPTTEGFVYFIRSEKSHAIKIGFTAGQPEKRLSSLQTAHPYKLQMLATIPGSLAYERSLHDSFSKIRLEGEWFQPHPDLLAFISTILKK